MRADGMRHKLAVFRADASPLIGGGHVMRCLTLSEALAEHGWRSIFAVSESTIAAFPALSRCASGHIHPLPGGVEADPHQLRLAAPGGCDLLVVDHYHLDAAYESACRPWADRIMVVDDLANRPHDCDILLDQNAGQNSAAYDGLTPESCQRLIGPCYAMLRAQFAGLRAETLARRASIARVERLFISMGSTDPQNATSLALAAIDKSGLSVAVDIVLGSAAPHLSEVQAQVARMTPRANLFIDCDDIARVMSAADLAIGAGGVTALERSCLGLPSIIITTAANQESPAHGLEAAGAAVVAGRQNALSADHLADLLRRLADPMTLTGMSQAAAACVTGDTAAVMAVVLATPSRGLILRPATMSDAQSLLAWRNDPLTRAASRHTTVIAPNEHAAWLERTLVDPRRHIMIAEWRDHPIGVVRLDVGVGESELSWIVAPDARGNGYGAWMVRKMLEMADGRAVAHVRQGNPASVIVAERAGLALESETNEWMIFAR